MNGCVYRSAERLISVRDLTCSESEYRDTCGWSWISYPSFECY